MMIVGMLSVLGMGFLSNSLGRKEASLISFFIAGFAILGVAISPNYWIALLFYSL